MALALSDTACTRCCTLTSTLYCTLTNGLQPLLARRVQTVILTPQEKKVHAKCSATARICLNLRELRLQVA